MATQIQIEQPPFETNIDLSAYLERMWLQVNSSFDIIHNFTPLTNQPVKVPNGALRYFDKATGDITSPGFWYFDGQWKIMGGVTQYGGVHQVSQHNYGTIDQSGSFVTNLTTGTFITPIGITQNTANDALTLNTTGVYKFDIIINLEHDMESFSRDIACRLITENGETTPYIWFSTAPNETLTNLIFSTTHEALDQALLGDVKIQIGFGDTYNNVVSRNQSFIGMTI